MNDTKKIIESTFVDVMESMGFDEVVPLEQMPCISLPFLIQIKVTMPYMGSFIVGFAEPLAIDIADNFFDHSISNQSDNIKDCLGELVNVFVGKVMQQLYPHLAFRIGMPELINHLPNENFVVHSFVDPNERTAIVYSCLEK